MQLDSKSASWLRSLLLHRYRVPRHPFFRPPLLIRLFLLKESVRIGSFIRQFGKENLSRLVRFGFAEERNGRLHPRVRIAHFHDLFLLADLRREKNFVYMGRDSYILANHLRHALVGKKYTHALDVGCATGIQAFSIAPHCKKVMAVDINPRAVEYAKFNAQLNARNNLYVLRSDLFKNLKGKKFDLIVANPPFVFLPADEHVRNRDGYGGGKYGMHVPFRILREALKYLKEKGDFYMISGSPIVHGRDLLLEELKNQKWGAVEAREVRHFVYREFHRFHAKHGIGHSVLYLVHIRKGPVSLHVKKQPLWKRLYDVAEMAAVRTLF